MSPVVIACAWWAASIRAAAVWGMAPPYLTGEKP